MTYTQEQIEKSFDLLPEEVQDKLFTPEVERKVQKIGFESGLLINQIKKLNSLVNFVILGLMDEISLTAECKTAFSLTDDDSKKIVGVIFKEIIAPIEATKAIAIKQKQLYKEVDENSDEIDKNSEHKTPSELKDTTTSIPPRAWEKEPDIAPDNLPTADESADESTDFVSLGTRLGREQGESFLPNLTPKTPAIGDVPAHPFEEKMKRVFATGGQSMHDLELEPIPPPASSFTTTSQPQAPRVDPYRESI